MLECDRRRTHGLARRPATILRNSVRRMADRKAVVLERSARHRSGRSAMEPRCRPLPVSDARIWNAIIAMDAPGTDFVDGFPGRADLARVLSRWERMAKHPECRHARRA